MLAMYLMYLYVLYVFNGRVHHLSTFLTNCFVFP